MTRLLFALGFFTALSTSLSAAPVPKVEPDPLPKGATARLGTNAFRGVRGMRPHGLSFTADGKKLIVSQQFGQRDDRQEFSVWDADTGKALVSKITPPAELKQSKKVFLHVRAVMLGDRIVWLACSPKGTTTAEVVVADYEGKLINKFEIEGQPNLHHFSYRDEFTGTVVTSNGRYLATTFGELAKATVAVYDLQTGREVFKLENQNGGPRVYFSRGRQTLYVKYGNKPIRRFEAATGKELDELPDTDPWVTQVVESPDGKLLVFGRHFSITSQKQRDLVKLLEVRDAATGKFTGKIELPGGPENLTFVGNETLMVHTRIPQSVPGKATFSRWNVPKQQCEWEVPAIGQWGFVLSPDNKRFASIGQQRVFTFNAETGEREVDPYYHSGPVEWIRFSADGKTLTTAAPGEVITWTNSGRRKETVGVPELRHGMQSVFNNARAHHGNELVWLDVGWNSGSSRNPEAQTIFGWDREKNAFGWKFKAASVLQVCRPEGNRVVCLGSNPKVKSDYVVTHYDGLTGKVVREWECPRPSGTAAKIWRYCTLSEDGRFAIVADDSAIFILNAETGKELNRVTTEAGKVGRNQRPPEFAISADGSKLAICGLKKMEVYDVKTDKLQASHEPKIPLPAALKFGPDGKMLAAWRLPSPQPSPVLVWEFGVTDAAPKPLEADPWAGSSCITFSPDGKTLAVGYLDGTTLLWDLTAKDAK